VRPDVGYDTECRSGASNNRPQTVLGKVMAMTSPGSGRNQNK